MNHRHIVIVVNHAGGGHGGGDMRLQEMIFNPNMPDPYKQAAGSRDGAMSALTGIAARKSIDEKHPIKISELIRL